MNLLDSIRSDILGSAPLSDTLRKATVLAYSLKNQEFKSWVHYELDGYYGDNVPELPEYRIVYAASMGQFRNMAWEAKNVPIDPKVFGDHELSELIQRVAMRQGTRELESLLESVAQSEAGWLQEPWPQLAAAYLSGRVYQGMHCVSASRVITREALHHILSTVRTRLLRFTLELAERYPEAALLNFEMPAKNPSSEQVGQVLHYTIHGGQHSFSAGSQAQHRIEAQTMSDTTIGDGNTFQGDFVIAHTIKQSFNKVASSDLPNSLKDLLPRLTSAVGVISKELSPETAQQVASDVETLTKEATSKAPRKQWIQLSADGLIKAAKNVGAVGVPLIGLNDELLPLLLKAS